MLKNISFFLAIIATLCPSFFAYAQSIPDIATERYQDYSVEYGQAQNALGVSRTITYVPHAKGPFPTVYFIQGYTCSSIDHRDTAETTRRALVESYANSGFLVFLVQKPGVGDSQSAKSCDEITFAEEVQAFEDAYEALLTHPKVDSENVFLFGHSMGGLIAPLIAKKVRTRGIITYGSVVKPWFEYMVDNFRSQSELFGMDPRTIQRDARLGIPFFYDLMIEKRPWSDIVSKHAEAIDAGLIPIAGEKMFGRHYTFWATLNDPDLVEAWANYEGKVLAIHGSYDIEAISPEAAKRTARIVNTYHPQNARFLILDQAEHTFARVDGTFEAYASSRLNGEWTSKQAFAQFDERIVTETVSWMRGVVEE